MFTSYLIIGYFIYKYKIITPFCLGYFYLTTKIEIFRKISGYLLFLIFNYYLSSFLSVFINILTSIYIIYNISGDKLLEFYNIVSNTNNELFKLDEKVKSCENKQKNIRYSLDEYKILINNYITKVKDSIYYEYLRNNYQWIFEEIGNDFYSSNNTYFNLLENKFSFEKSNNKEIKENNNLLDSKESASSNTNILNMFDPKLLELLESNILSSDINMSNLDIEKMIDNDINKFMGSFLQETTSKKNKKKKKKK